MKKVKAFLFYLVQFTWGLPQNLAGGIAYIKMRGKYKHERFHYGFVTYVSAKNFGGVSLGIFTFVNPSHSEDWVHDTRIHEYGHTIQSLLLGPLFFIVVGIPSFIWCNVPVFVKRHKGKPGAYYKLYCESWANSWGSRWAKDGFRDTKYMKSYTKAKSASGKKD